VSLPPLGDEPAATDADDARVDVRRERQLLEEEALRDAGASPSRPDDEGGAGPPTSSGDPDGDPTSLENTVRRISNAPEDPAVEKFLRMGYARDAVVLALAMWGDAEAKIVDFCDGFERMRELGFAAEIVAGALASCDNKVEDAISSCLR
jgi:hypothetical protein